MTKLLLLLMLAMPLAADWATGFGWNFRGTLGFATDPPHTTAVLNGEVLYPITRTVDSTLLTFGWETYDNGYPTHNNRATGTDPRLAGSAVVGYGAVRVFRVILPSAGTYRIYLAVGDSSSANTERLEIFDDTTSIGIPVNNVAHPFTGWVDAAGTVDDNSSWVTSGSTVYFTANMSSTIMRFQLGGINYNSISHIYIQQISGATPPVAEVRRRIIN